MVLDEVDAADEGALAEQRGLRAFHDFDAFHVEDGEVCAIAWITNGDAVLEQGNARRAAVGNDPAQRVARRVEALCLNLQARHEIAEVFNVVSCEFVDQVLIGDGHVDRNIYQGLFLLLGRHRNGFKAAVAICGIRVGESDKLAGEGESCKRGCRTKMTFHEKPIPCCGAQSAAWRAGYFFSPRPSNQSFANVLL